MLQTYDDKIDEAVHAALTELGLSVENNMAFAIELHDHLYTSCVDIVTDDE